MIGWDTETFLIAPALRAPPLVCVSWASSAESVGLVHANDPDCLKVVEWLLSGHMTLANAPFDFCVVGQKWPHLIPMIFDALAEDRVHDVLTREKLLDIARGRYRWEEDDDGNFKRVGYSLAEVCRRRLGIILKKDEFRMNYHDRIHLPLEQWEPGARKYAIDDSVNTLLAFHKQEPLAEFMPDRFAQERAHMALALISAWGIKTNLEAVKTLEARIIKEREEILGDLMDEKLVREDGTRDTKRAKRSMRELLGDDCIVTQTGLDLVKEGQITTAQAINQGYISLSRDACLLSGWGTLIKYSRYSQLQNLLNKDVKDMKNGVVTPIQTRFEQLMETGRVSSSSPNIQNIRREPGTRECYRPRTYKTVSGETAYMVFVAADYGAAELVSLSQVCINLFGKSEMAKAINRGIDPHLWMAANILKITYDAAKTRYKEEKKEEDRIWKLKRSGQAAPHFYGPVIEARQMAKAANFGFPGGLGVKRFVGYAQGYGVDIDYHQAAKLKRQWLTTWPEMELYFEWVNNQAQTDGWHWVQQHVSGRWRGKMTFTQCANTMFQGLTSDGAKAAMWEVARRQYSEPRSALYGTHTVNFIHDELIIECKQEIAQAVALELCEIMETEYNKYTPDVPVEAEPTIMRYWSKKAKQLWKSAANDTEYLYKGMSWQDRIAAGDELLPWGEEAA